MSTEISMLENGMVYILGVTAVIGIILFVRKIDVILKCITRACMGAVLIYGGNMVLQYLGISCLVGVNAVTLICSGILGLPGVGLLYAIQIFL